MSSWSSLSSIDKQAFYSILDEYFESRPHLFQNNSPSSNNNNNNNNNNPSRLISNIISSSKPSNQPNSNGNSNNQDSPFKAIGMVSSLMNHNNNNNNNNNNKNGSNGQSQVNPLSAASKIHSLSQSFNQSNNNNNNNNNNSNPKPPVSNRHTPSGLASSQKFFGGMVSQSEKDAANAKPRGILAEAAASANQKITNNNNNNNNFLPPPTRSNTQPVKKLINQSNLDLHDDDSELVEAIYDYSGTSPEDLSFKEHQIIKVTEHISDDWWNGQIDDGPIGMFPSSYVKPI